MSASQLQSTFAFPELYNFPPFFTLQSNATTRAAQVDAWLQLIRQYCRHCQMTQLQLSRDTTKLSLFCNSRLQRQLSTHNVRLLLNELVRQRYAVWDSDSDVNANNNNNSASVSAAAATDDDEASNATSDVCHVTYHTLSEWASQLHNDMSQLGQLNTIHTVHELLDRGGDHSDGTGSGGEYSDKEWCQALDSKLMLAVLRLLQRQGKALLIKGATLAETGVKFKD